MIDRVMSRLRVYIYKKGFRPKFGSIWYSPSLEAIIKLGGDIKKARITKGVYDDSNRARHFDKIIESTIVSIRETDTRYNPRHARRGSIFRKKEKN